MPVFEVIPAIAASGKTTIMAYLVAHSIGIAVVAGISSGVGTYYLAKAIANRASRKKTDPAR